MIHRFAHRKKRANGDVRKLVHGPVPAALFEAGAEETLELLEQGTLGAEVQDVFPGDGGVELRVVDVGQEPVGRQLHSSVAGRRQRLFSASWEARNNPCMGLFNSPKFRYQSK